jgi:hypothetical protein
MAGTELSGSTSFVTCGSSVIGADHSLQCVGVLRSYDGLAHVEMS